jgi:alkaline phosphatase D
MPARDVAVQWQVATDDVFANAVKSGYVRCTLDHERWTTDLRMVSTVSRPDADIETLASFVELDSQPGVQPL